MAVLALAALIVWIVLKAAADPETQTMVDRHHANLDAWDAHLRRCLSAECQANLEACREWSLDRQIKAGMVDECVAEQSALWAELLDIREQ